MLVEGDILKPPKKKTTTHALISVLEVHVQQCRNDGHAVQGEAFHFIKWTDRWRMFNYFGGRDFQACRPIYENSPI